jgi:Domain of unknown function (DUF4397)
MTVKFTRIARLAAAAGLALGMVGLAAPAASAASPTGWLRLAHLSPNTPAVDVYLYSFGNSSAMVVLKHVTYGTVSGYEKVASGEYTVAMRGAGAAASTKPVLSTTINVSPGNAYTVAGMGPAAGLRLQVFQDALTTPKGKSLVRVIQASLQQHKVTVRAGGHALVRNLPFSDVTSYKPVAAGTWQVHAAGGTEQTSKSISLAAGSIHTIVVLDDPGSLTLDNLTDAVGSATAPAGAPATGLGGTAPRPGASLLPWLAIVSAGLLLTAAGAIRRRQSRLRSVRTR